MNPNYPLLIFDWDGTLADSTAHIVANVQAAFVAYGQTPPSDNAVRNIIGLGLNEAIHALLPQLSAAQQAQIADAYRHRHFTQAAPTQLFADARSVLTHLQAHFTLAIATGKSRRGLNDALADTNSRHFFAATRTVDECASKPHPEMVLSLCDELGFTPQQALVIGDTTHDLFMAANAGSKAVALTTGAHNLSQLHSAPHETVLSSLSQLPNWLGCPLPQAQQAT